MLSTENWTPHPLSSPNTHLPPGALSLVRHFTGTALVPHVGWSCALSLRLQDWVLVTCQCAYMAHNICIMFEQNLHVVRHNADSISIPEDF